ncbi:IclR family transcriptional regulator [Microbacterium sp. Leaf159]|uniref:IclR family transcriptional regulator n=1 Tax=Microbacterium sp. Leaf159 TaxID=1736279 RepID=UPI0006F32129|nr:IclR family transcriptional regulator [Microbacterium sp. Leaf159]KQR39341.1 IclR family transcriptional regulator [Microbacterium sp. Leaf159]
MTAPQDEERLVGADRVLAVMIALSEHPTGATLEEVAHSVGATKSTVHRALATLRRAGLATQLGRGVYILGDEFYRIAFRSYSLRPEGVLIQPALDELSRRFGETVHFAVLDGVEVVYRAKVDPPTGAIRLTSVVGGRNPAHATGVGKVLLAETVNSEDELRSLLGDEYPQRTPATINSAEKLWAELELTKERGYGVDDQESEAGINCVAVPVRLGPGLPPIGAISISGLTFRTPLAQMIARLDEINSVVHDYRGSSSD